MSLWYVWMLPWILCIPVVGTWLVFLVKWRVKILPVVLVYMMWTTAYHLYENPGVYIATLLIYSLITAILFTAFCLMKERIIQPLLVVGGLGMLAVISVYWLMHPEQRTIYTPLMGNPSMSGTFVVLALLPAGFFWIPMAGALIVGRSTPLFMLGSYWIARSHTIFKTVLVILGVGSFVYFMHPELPLGEGRFMAWAQYWHYWAGKDHLTHLIGFGLGSTPHYLTVAQFPGLYLPQEAIPLFFGHNDFLQAFMELGWIGFILCVSAGIELLMVCSRREKALAVAMLTAMLTNYPWHLIPDALVYWLWVKRNGLREQPSQIRFFRGPLSK